MHRALRLQFTIYYAMPAIPPLFVSVPFLLSLCNATDPGVTEGFYRPLNIICITLALFFMIYAVACGPDLGAKSRLTQKGAQHGTVRHKSGTGMEERRLPVCL